MIAATDDTHSDLRVTFGVGGKRTVSGLLRARADSRACIVLAHGAGAGMLHASMETLAIGLAQRGFATFRYHFPYMEEGGGRPDPPRLAHATVRAAVAEASCLMPGMQLIAGGRSFGGRMTSQAQAASPLPGVRGLVCFAFPLHPPKQISGQRGAHLSNVHIPMLFLQGSRDGMADPGELGTLIERIGGRATLKTLAEADHSFHVPARSGRTDQQVMEEALDAVVDWFEPILLNKG